MQPTVHEIRGPAVEEMKADAVGAVQIKLPHGSGFG